ncbi:MAG: S41 family peptidase [Anaerolineaceae bacterium]|nr:S41 family peptidase [Anaerolineaceae bacterium]
MKNHPFWRSIVSGAVVGTILGLTFLLGFLSHDLINTDQVMGIGVAEFPLLNEVQVLLDQHYLREQPEHSALEYGAIRGVLETLDDHYTFFIEPPVAQSESDVLAGTYGGIGVQIQRNEQGQMIVYPYDDSPAVTEGIMAGAVLVAINGVPVDISMQPDLVDQMLRGEVKDGNGVTLTVIQSPDGDEFTTFVPFGVINVPSVTWRVVPEDLRIGYLQVLRFTNRTPDELAAAISELETAGVEGLVLDLRDNSGGLLNESIMVAGQFLGEGVVVYERNNQTEKALEADSPGAITSLPLVVLINHNTASAAELVAGAIQDRRRGILIGQQTFGKGTVQQIFRLSDGSSLHVTSAEWFTPEYQKLDGVGLQPDIAIIPDINGRDVELGEALRQLSSQLAQE